MNMVLDLKKENMRIQTKFHVGRLDKKYLIYKKIYNSNYHSLSRRIPRHKVDNIMLIR